MRASLAHDNTAISLPLTHVKRKEKVGMVKRKTPKTTLADLLEVVYYHYWSQYKDGFKSYVNAKSLVELLGPSKNPQKVTTSQLDGIVKHLKKVGNKPATINRKLSALSKLFSFGQERGYLIFKPTIPFQNEGSSSNRVDWFTIDQQEATVDYFNSINEPEVASLINFLCDTGLRVGEALALTPENIQDGCVYIEDSKNGTSRLVPLTDRASQVSLPFTTSQRRLNYLWSKMRKATGLDKKYVIHTCRHTFCSRLVQKGVPLETIKNLAGHKTLAMTTRYAHLSTSNLKDAIAQLEN